MEMTVVGFMSRQKPDRRQLAEHWAEKCISFFEDPENEREYQEWKKHQNGGKNNGTNHKK